MASPAAVYALALLGGPLFACWTGGHGAAEESPEPRSAVAGETFRSLRLDYGGGGCVDCWRRFEVTAPDRFAVADAEGSAEFSLSAEEADGVRELVTSRAFRLALDGQAPCKGSTDGGATLTVVWPTGASATDSGAGSCIRGRGAETHPYHTLGWLLIDYKQKYLQCPELDPAQPWDPSAPPPVRMLCFACGGEC